MITALRLMEYFESRYVSDVLAQILGQLSCRATKVMGLISKTPLASELDFMKTQLASNVYQSAESSLRELELALTSSKSEQTETIKEDLSILYTIEHPIFMQIDDDSQKLEKTKNFAQNGMNDSICSLNGQPSQRKKQSSKTNKPKVAYGVQTPSELTPKTKEKCRHLWELKIADPPSTGYYASILKRSQRSSEEMKSSSSNGSNLNELNSRKKPKKTQKPRGMIASLLSKILTPQSGYMTAPFSGQRMDKSSSFQTKNDLSNSKTPQTQPLILLESFSPHKSLKSKREAMKSGACLADSPIELKNVVTQNDLPKSRLEIMGTMKAQKHWTSLFAPHKADRSTSRQDSSSQFQDSKRRNHLQNVALGSLVRQKGVKSMIIQKTNADVQETATPGVTSRMRQHLQSPLKSASLANSAEAASEKTPVLSTNCRELKRPSTTDRLLQNCSMTYADNTRIETVSIKRTLEALKKNNRNGSWNPSVYKDALKAPKNHPMFKVVL